MQWRSVFTSGGVTMSEIIDRIPAEAAADGTPDADANVVGDEFCGAVAHYGLDAARVTAASGHHGRRRGSRDEHAGWVQRILGLALADGEWVIGDRTVGPLVAGKDSTAAPPAKPA